MNKILITTYSFYPEITPRSFRVFELAKEFRRRDYEVDIMIPEIDYDFTELSEMYNFNVYKISSGFLFNKNAKSKNIKKGTINEQKSLIKNILISISKFFYLGGKSFEYAFSLYNQLMKLDRKQYEIVLSVGLPISVHLGTALYLNRIKPKISIADYGDPFSFNNELESKFHFKFIEKMILNKFDYITVPIREAVKNYTFFKDKKFIKVIPQGFDFSTIKIAEYKKNHILSFGYAGVFYEKIRNPKVLFEYLVKLDFDFRFVIYTDRDKLQNMKLIKPYMDLLGNKLLVKSLIPREECIYNLSKMDFIINQNNLGEEQKPSKLIDYALTKRPVFNFTQNNFIAGDLLLFVNEKVDFNIENVSMYKIENIVDSFEVIFNKE